MIVAMGEVCAGYMGSQRREWLFGSGGSGSRKEGVIRGGET